MTDHGRPAADPDSQVGPGGDNPSDLLDAQRASAAMRGDSGALRELWHQNRRWVAGVLLAHKPRTIDLEDLLQDVALSMVRRIEDLRDPAALRPWLRQVAINAARAAGRMPGRPKLPATTVDAVRRLDEAGATRADIARSLGISRSSVYRALVP